MGESYVSSTLSIVESAKPTKPARFEGFLGFWMSPKTPTCEKPSGRLRKHLDFIGVSVDPKMDKVEVRFYAHNARTSRRWRFRPTPFVDPLVAGRLWIVPSNRSRLQKGRSASRPRLAARSQAPALLVEGPLGFVAAASGGRFALRWFSQDAPLDAIAHRISSTDSDESWHYGTKCNYT